MEVNENDESWCEQFMLAMMVNTIVQWVNKAVTYTREEQPSQLDLLFTKPRKADRRTLSEPARKKRPCGD